MRQRLRAIAPIKNQIIKLIPQIVGEGGGGTVGAQTRGTRAQTHANTKEIVSAMKTQKLKMFPSAFVNIIQTQRDP